MMVSKIEVIGDTGHKYEITTHEGGKVLYCTCPSWKYSNKPTSQRTCKHIAFVAAQTTK